MVLLFCHKTHTDQLKKRLVNVYKVKSLAQTSTILIVDFPVKLFKRIIPN